MITLIGFVTGILIGLTGTGGGVLLTPLLLLFTPFPAVVVIGTGIVSGAVTKAVGVLEHRRFGHIKWEIAGFLVLGTVPGTLGGILFLKFLKMQLATQQFDHLLRTILGLTLFGLSLLLPFVRKGEAKWAGGLATLDSGIRNLMLTAVGAIVGLLVVLTSVGSGSLVMVFLLLLFPLPVAHLVGTDLMFGLATTTVAGLLHLWMGHFMGSLFFEVIVGMLPGVVVGSRLTHRIPEKYFNWFFSLLYFSLGARLLAG